MYKPAPSTLYTTNPYGNSQIQNGVPSQNSTISNDFHGFHSNQHQQASANEIENNSRITQNGFAGFHTSSSSSRDTSRPSRNEPDRGNQPESATLAAFNSDVLQQQYGISQSKPRHPDYAVKAVRINTFRNFPPEITQTAEDMAQAGFFYSGRDDIVYCFFCGQGLRAWEPEDDVWIEHARWAPHCVHLLNCKGSEFVRMVQIAETNPETSYPSAQNGVDRVDLSSPVAKPTVNGHASGGFKLKEDITEKRTLEDSNSTLLNTIAAQSVITNGYSKDSVVKAINVFRLKEGRSDFNAMDLLKIIFDIEDGSIKYDEFVSSANFDNQSRSDSDLQPQTAEQPVINGDTSNTPEVDQKEAKSLLAENRQLKDQTTCKICLEETVSIVFLPCGHLCCCSQCAPALRKCPICRGFIKGTVKTYLP